MLSHPSFVSSDNAGDSEGETFLPQQTVSTVAGTERPDFSLRGSMGDDHLFRITRPMIRYLR